MIVRKLFVILVLGTTVVPCLSTAATEGSTFKPAKVVSIYVERGAIVEAVDIESRELKLIDSEGDRFSVIVADEVENLDKIEPRDRIVARYLESVAVTIKPGGPDVEPMSGEAEEVVVAPADEKPAVGAVETELVVGVVRAINLSDRLLTLQTAAGDQRTIKVSPDAPLEAVTVGDEFQLQVTRAVALSVVRPSSD